MYRSVMLPLDGSRFSEQALPLASKLAGACGASLRIVHVHQPHTEPDWDLVTPCRYEGVVEAEREWEHDAVKLEQRYLSQHVGAECKVLEGEVVPTLEQEIETSNPDLIVMATHGRGGLSRAWLGSVADGLVRHTPVPVLLVRPGAEWPGDLVEPLFRRVLIPLDGSATATEVLDRAVRLGTPDATVYTLLTVVVPLPLPGYQHPAGATDDDRPFTLQQRDAALAHLSALADELRGSGTRVETRVVVHDRPAQAILDEADAQRVDAIALSTHGRGVVARRLLGSVADKILRGAAVPVLVYRPERAGEEPARHAALPVESGPAAPPSPRTADRESAP